MATAKQTFETNLKNLNDIINIKLGITANKPKRTISQIVSAVSSMNVTKSMVLTEHTSLEDNKSLYIVDPDHDDQAVGTYSYYRLGELLFVRLNSLEPFGSTTSFSLVNFPDFTFDPIKFAYNYIDGSQSKLGGELYFSLADSRRVNVRYYLNSDSPVKNAKNLKYAVGQWFCLKVFSFIEEFDNFAVDIESEKKNILDAKNNVVGSYTFYKLGSLVLININSYDNKESLTECQLEDFPVKLYITNICSFSDYINDEPIYGNLVVTSNGKLSGALSTGSTDLNDILPSAMNQWFTIIGN